MLDLADAKLKNTMSRCVHSNFQSLDRPVLIDSEGIAVFSYGTALSLVLFFAPSNVEIDFLNPFEGCLM